MVALVAEPVATEIDPNLIRLTAASNHLQVAAALMKGWSAEARRLSPATPGPAWLRPEYKRPASLPQKFDCKLGSVS